MTTMKTTIPSWGTAFTATHRLRPDHQLKTPAALPPSTILTPLQLVYKSHVTTAVHLSVMVRFVVIYIALFHFTLASLSSL
jgi:hypothetical protein